MLFAVELIERVEPPVLELDYSGSFFKQQPPFVRARTQNLIDTSLSDNGVTLAPDTSIHKHFVYISQPTLCTVEHIFTLARAVDATRYSYLREIRLKLKVGVIDCNRDLGEAQRAAVFRAGENDILHLDPAQTFRALLAQHPAHSVGDITLAAAVGADYGRNARVKLELYFFGKGFKTLNIQPF